jgi:hypothetical protein
LRRRFVVEHQRTERYADEKYRNHPKHYSGPARGGRQLAHLLAQKLLVVLIHGLTIAWTFGIFKNSQGGGCVPPSRP